ncbi:TPSN protein, partial [Urocolius indicus]|nr:TPSN protein [Urocolius indicus]
PSTPPPPLLCPLLGPGGVLSQKPALLRFGGSSEPPPTTPNTSQDPNSTFDVTDPWGTLTRAWRPPWTPPKCELSPTVLTLTPPPWAPSLGLHTHSPPGLGGSWWVASLGTPGYSVTALLQGQSPPSTATAVTATLSVFTLTPELRGSPGTPLDLHCAFTSPLGPFALEWRHQHRGAGRRLLTYDSATSRVPEADPGVQLLLGTSRGLGGDVRNVTLRLHPLHVAHQGTYVCAVFMPRGQAQQVLHVRVLEPPTVTLRPCPLLVAPGSVVELLCDTSGYFPLDVGVRWQRRAGGSGQLLPLEETVAKTWATSHRQGPGGTFSRSNGIRLVPARLRHHGDVYSCLVTHAALEAPRRVHVRLEVAGAVGPGVEDAVGLFLVAFVLYGLWRWLSPRCELCPQSVPMSH